MKLQCSCGAKYAFEATSEMVNHPVKFICPSCGLDSSAFVNELIRQEFGAPAAAPAASSAPPPPPASARLKVAVEAAPAAPTTDAPAVSQLCAKHREPATEHCRVCHKPICPQCMDLFGYFCSPLCKGKAEAQHLNVPVFKGGKGAAEARFWRQTGLIATSLGLLIALFIGLWIWYAWFGSVPHPYFSVRFDDSDRGYFGSAHLVGKDQLVALHGGTLARYDLKNKKTVWSQDLIAPEDVARIRKRAEDARARMSADGEHLPFVSGETLERLARQSMQAQLSLYVLGQNIWLAKAGKLTHYDWESGKVLRNVLLPEDGGNLVLAGDELQIVGLQSITRVSPSTGDTRVEQFASPDANPAGLASANTGGGLPGTVGDNGQFMDPNKVEGQVQNMKLQGQIALPALISNAKHEKELEQALNDDLSKIKRANGLKAPPAESAQFELVSGNNDVAGFSSRLLEEHQVTRSAMKAAPKKSVLDGNLNVTQTGAAANEILNDMQRNAGNDQVTEDESRYQVTVRVSGSPATPDWTGEVVGPPQLLVLKSVNVVAAGKSVTVLDKANKKLWQAALTYPVPESLSGPLASGRALQYGAGPCVEHGDALYVFDKAVLTVFDLNSGNARWRLPSVGVVGLFFDGQNNLYVNTTTGNPDDIKYSRQIDVNRRTEAVVSKIDPKSGKLLWSAKPGGFASYVSGKFIYVIDSYDPNPMDEEVNNDMIASLQKPPYLHLMRLRPSDGRVMWDYYDRSRCPVNWNFDDNSIQLIFKREVQVLRYLAL